MKKTEVKVSVETRRLKNRIKEIDKTINRWIHHLIEEIEKSYHKN